ncbi:flavin-containing monooxygenase [Aspergillus ibericus CBS 121593]|uniref:FAD/NAD(P)-binding domain-containing protein n=1 Tax=Aspergillus ibericus CBS 121593 TaxID=1448316 RepID=A0A395H1J6_9EURO|nr:FAD/NAD(P)-binding domain-containing protein [Aspergillus ibericus CBS 121593]RAL00084.1 FAD/NAD(P)-binding domain-containing protein [Aspergillus ibericus CBS 121593]
MSSDSQIERVNDVVIIGAGFSGLTMACQLQRKLNHFDYVIYERSAEIGGTWWANKYPGCAVDIPAACYSLSFAPNAEFTKFFPSQKEVLSYIWKVADKYNVRPHVFCNVECEGALWNNERKRWLVKLRDSISRCTILQECKILISAVGALVNSKPFSLPGTDLFQGPIIHTARWPQDAVVRGKNVVVVGNGASVAQLIPSIAQEARSIAQFIRTPHYYIPSRNVDIGSAWRNLFLYVPGVLLILRLIIFLYLETASFMFGLDARSKNLRHHYADRSKEYVRRVAPEKYWPLLLPRYELGCKRRVFENQNYMKCLQEDHVSLTDDPITAVKKHSILTRSGKEYPADVIVLATGSSLTQWDTNIYGRDGRSQSDHWKSYGCIEAYHSIAMSGFPNFFYILGPNSGRGHTSKIYAIESYTTQVLRIVTPILKGQRKSVEVKPEKEKEYHERLQLEIEKTVWATSCASYFIDSETGKNWFIYPWSSFRMWYTTRLGSLEDRTYE